MKSAFDSFAETLRFEVGWWRNVIFIFVITPDKCQNRKCWLKKEKRRDILLVSRIHRKAQKLKTVHWWPFMFLSLTPEKRPNVKEQVDRSLRFDGEGGTGCWSFLKGDVSLLSLHDKSVWGCWGDMTRSHCCASVKAHLDCLAGWRKF